MIPRRRHDRPSAAIRPTWLLKTPASFMAEDFEKDVENFRAEGRAASIVTSYVEKRNAVERDVDGDVLNAVFRYQLTRSG